jgi:hypothetical protein
MKGDHRFTSRPGLPKGRARIVAMATIPVALILGVGVGLAVTGNMPVSMPGLRSASLTAANPAASGSPGQGANTAGPDLAESRPRDPLGNPIGLHQGPNRAANTGNCTLLVPDNPLTAVGLATPWQLGDGCSQANAAETAFVEATILAPNGQVTIYDPLVVTAGTQPAAPPAPVTVPTGSQVIIDTGFNGNNLVLEGRGASQGNCIDAFGDSIIAQTAACNSQAFYQDANAQIAAGTLKVPPLGVGADGKPCESTRSFSLIDQDQSDNVLTVYVVNPAGQTAQATGSDVDTMGGSTISTNGSDDGLLGHFVDAALGCARFTAPNPTSPGSVDDSQALNELSARVNQQAPVALLPVNDPQLLVNGQFSIGKTNAYRRMTDQPQLPATTDPIKNAEMYCQQMVNIAPARLQADIGMEATFQSPVPTLGNNLATLMGARLSASFGNLNCQNFGLTDPVMLSMNGAGVAVAVTYNTSHQTAHLPRPGPTPTPSASASVSPSPSGSGTPSPTPSPSATAPSPTPSATQPSPTPSPSFTGY